jgi:hypothetical protein
MAKTPPVCRWISLRDALRAFAENVASIPMKLLLALRLSSRSAAAGTCSNTCPRKADPASEPSWAG